MGRHHPDRPVCRLRPQSAEDLVDKTLKYVFSKDREFQAHLKILRSLNGVSLCASAEMEWISDLGPGRWREARRRGGGAS